MATASPRSGGRDLAHPSHCEPEQVVADFAILSRPQTSAAAEPRPGGAAPPGEGHAVRTGSSSAAPCRFIADRAIRAVFSRGGACYDCHRSMRRRPVR